MPVHVVDTFLDVNPASLQEFWFKIAVIAVCQNSRISGNVLELLLQKGPRESLIPSVRTKLLPFAMKSENVEVVKVLIDNFPWVLSETCHPNDEIPLHGCVDTNPTLLELLLEQGIIQRIGNVGGLFMKNKYSESLFDNLVAAISVSDQLDNNNESRWLKWRRLELCISYANSVRTGELRRHGSSLSFACIGFLPSHLVDEALRVLEFKYKSTDIYNLINMATTHDAVWKRRFRLDYKYVAKIIDLLLQTRKKLRSKHKYSQQYLLHYAAMRGLRWEALKVILQWEKESRNKLDCKTNLLPFMAAASAPSSDLDAIFNLLLSDPSQVKEIYDFQDYSMIN